MVIAPRVPFTSISAARQRKTVKSRFRICPDWKMPRGFLTTPRQKMPTLPANRRIGIAEVELGFHEEQGRAEGLRCLNCQVNTIFDGSKCILCAGCVDVCPENCLRLVDLVQVSGDARYDALIQAPLRRALGRATAKRDRPGPSSRTKKNASAAGSVRRPVSHRRHHHGIPRTTRNGKSSNREHAHESSNFF